MKKAFHHCLIFNGKSILKEKAILTENGKIIGIVNEKNIPSEFLMFNLNGNYVSSTFIDLQIYGGSGHLFSLNPTVEALKGIYKYCRNGGALFFQATVATNSLEIMLKAIDVAKEYRALGLPGLIGIHLEGPYINKIQKGAHLAQFIRNPNLDEINLLLQYGEGILTMMTLAPEICNKNVLALLKKGGVKISAGHSNASYKEAISAFNYGIETSTHLFNAMSPFQSREPGLVGAIFDHNNVKSSIVADGIHVDFASVRISKNILKERLYLITDAVEENATGDYIYIRNKDRYLTKDGTLAGSVLTMISAVKNCVNYIGIDLKESLRMASTYPAALMNMDKRIGKIEEGFDAAMVVFDKMFNVIEIISE